MAQTWEWVWAISFWSGAMAKLTAAKRNKIPASGFALAGGRYPIPDESHARNALARISQFGSPAEKTQVRLKVHAKFPAISVEGVKGTNKTKSMRKRVSEKG